MSFCKITQKKLKPFMSFGQMPLANGFLLKKDFQIPCNEIVLIVIVICGAILFLIASKLYNISNSTVFITIITRHAAYVFLFM